MLKNCLVLLLSLWSVSAARAMAIWHVETLIICFLVTPSKSHASCVFTRAHVRINGIFLRIFQNTQFIYLIRYLATVKQYLRSF